MDHRFQTDLLLFRSFFKIGCCTFGGGWSIVAQIQKEFVERRGWLTEEELLDYTSMGRSLPGVMIGNISFFCGHRIDGIRGGVACVLGLSLPSFLILAVVTQFYLQLKDNVYVARALVGVRAAVIPIIASAALRLRKSALPDKQCLALAVGALLLFLFTPLNAALLVALGGGVGLALQEVRRRWN